MRVLFIVVLVFITGLLFGHYKPFPLNHISQLKHALTNKDNSRHLSTKRLFEAVDRNVDIVILGDSISAAGRWQDLLHGYVVANRGISGDTSAGILNRLDSVVSLSPKVVFLMLGVNDIKSGIEVSVLLDNYASIISELKEHGIDVVVQSTLLTSFKDRNSKIKHANTLLKNLSKKLNFRYVDINQVLAPTGALTTEVSYDGIHLYQDAYFLWGKVINNTLTILLPS